MNFFERVKELEEYFNVDHEESYILKPGAGCVMFSAPHSVPQTREGKVKYSEPGTGVLAELLHEELKCPVIYKTANCNDDANYDEQSSYRDELERYIKENNIKMVVDLHQLASTRDVMIDIGTGLWKHNLDINMLNIVLKAFSSRKIGNIQIDTPFDASFEYTVSAAMSRLCGIPCVQIEMNSRLVHDEYEEYCIDRVFDALCDIHKELTVLF